MDTESLLGKLEQLYSKEEAKQLTKDIFSLIENSSIKGEETVISESDAALITYANSVVEPDKAPLDTLNTFLLENKLDSVFPIVHLLPFFPWDQDRGFSVKDYYRVQDEYGDWSDIERLSKSTKLMFDFVANHASIENPIIQAALIDRHIDSSHPLKESTSNYCDFVIAFSDDNRPGPEVIEALSRPRAYPVLTPYVVHEKNGQLEAVLAYPGGIEGLNEIGHGWVWTTFSRAKAKDRSEGTRQVDLNYKNPAVFLEVLKIMLFYREKGAVLIRLDAIGYLWKKAGSSSIHEKETHLILDILYDIMKVAAPGTITVAEVNEPQASGFTYLGTKDAIESDWVYQFTHFPLALHGLFRETTKYYREWLPTTSEADGRQFVTSLGTHDGIGFKPVRGILPESEIDAFGEFLIDHRSGRPNYAKLPGGKQIVYEICGTPWALINGSRTGQGNGLADGSGDSLPFEIQLRRYLTVLGLSFLVRGLPAVYINGVLGAENYLPPEGLDEDRTMNREVFKVERLRSEISNPDSLTSQVLKGVRSLFALRAAEPAFSPQMPSVEPFDCGNDKILTTLVPSQKNPLLVTANFSCDEQTFTLDDDVLDKGDSVNYSDALSSYKIKSRGEVKLAPYQTCWFK